MKEFIDKLISRLEERKGTYFDGVTCEGTMIRINDAISIVNQLAEEYKGGWIPCSGCKDCQHKECEHYGEI